MAARVLVIEDHPANLELMVYLLRAFGHSPTEARDGLAGVEAALRDPPELILCDIAMPKLDGYGVARLLKSDPRLHAVPLIAVTASAMVGDRARVIEAGFDGYISKPIDPETFVAQIEGYLARKATPEGAT